LRVRDERLVPTSLKPFLEAVKRVPAASLEFHVERGHLAEWLRSALGDPEAASAVEALRGLKGEELRERLLAALGGALARALNATASS